MAATETLNVILRLIAGDYKKEAKEAATATSQIGGAAQRAATSATGGFNLMKTAVVGLVGSGLVAWAKGTVESLARIERIGAQTDAVIRSTGGAANVTRQEIDDLATSLERVTSVEAESITEGQNLLLTFTKIRNEAGEGNDIFDQTTKVMLDMSVAMGTDAAGSAIQLGKALNDPVAGLTALTRVGVTFTKAQKDLIASLVQSGDVLGAQKIILAELNTEFGGSAAALGATLTGRIDRATQSFGAMGESIAESALPAVEDLTAAATRLFDEMGPMSAAAATAKWALASLGTDGIDVLTNKVPAALTALQEVAETTGFLLDLTPRMADALGELNTTLEFSATDWHEMREAIASGRVDLGLTADELVRLIALLQAEEVALSSAHPGRYTKGVEDAADAQFHLGQETSRTTDEIKAQHDAVRASIDPLFALRQASEKNRDAQVEYNAAVGEFGPNSIEARDAALDLISAQADLNYYAELYSANFGPAQEEAFRRVSLQAGLTNEQIDKIIRSTDALNNKQVDIYITTHTAVAREAVEDNLIGGKAAGGPVKRGVPYIVGEKGPELMIPDQSGTILPNGSSLFGGGSVTYITKTGPAIYVSSPTNDLRGDIQYATILASLTNLVEGF